MSAAKLLIPAAGLVVAGVLGLLTVAASSSQTNAASTSPVTGCDPANAADTPANPVPASSGAGPGPLDSLEAAVLQGQPLTPRTRRIARVKAGHAAVMVAQGEAMGVGRRGEIVGLVTALREAQLLLYANDGTWSGGGVSRADLELVKTSLRYPHDAVGHDHDSLGLVQLRKSRGTVAQRMNPYYDAMAFYRALVKVPGWQQLPPGAAAQAVQLSAYPDAYAQQERLARRILDLLPRTPLLTEAAARTITTAGITGGAALEPVCGAVPAGGDTAPGSAGVVLAAARAQIGVPYAWAGGDLNGPTPGRCDAANGAPNDCHVTGFDCSGLTLYAWGKAGKHLAHLASEQYLHGGTVLPYAQAHPGDLLFWAAVPPDPATIHHVAIYLGGGQMIEAPQSGQLVRVTPVRRDAEFMPNVVRP